MTRQVAPPLGLALVAFIAYQLWQRRRRSRALATIALEHALLLSTSALVVSAATARHYVKERDVYRDRDKVHFATYYDFGSPPVPARPDRPKQLGGTFYRGNDERNPKLFNGGHYRTSTFELSLVDADGKAVTVGTPIGGRRLFVRYEVKRAPFTPDHFYTPDAMSVLFLTRDSSPYLESLHTVVDRVGLSAVEPMQRWRADFPIGVVSRRTATGPSLATATAEELARVPGVGRTAAEWLVAYREHNGGIHKSSDLDLAGIEGGPRHALSRLLEEDVLEGIVYVAQTILKDGNKGPPLGARFHYGIRFELHARGDVLTDDSDLWMNFLYRSRKVARSLIPDDQWFSIQPIPELPAKGTDDPLLLGVDEYM
ncbi:MAG: helix-hairpin-helix domain-containing protein [Deltaproteobacteria bacterium]|nr:helix-hairpin-helix domain-containing protein [Deltaproteobacteria bacterium]